MQEITLIVNKLFIYIILQIIWIYFTINFYQIGQTVNVVDDDSD